MSPTSAERDRRTQRRYEALLVVSFGGPEHPDDVMGFLENVTRGRDVPPQRLATVAERYNRFGGKSPINDLNRSLIAALSVEMRRRDIDLAVYWGNRNWAPYIAEATQQMADDGINRALGLVTSAYSGYSGCRQYLDDISIALAATESDLVIEKLRPYWNHPGFIEANVTNVREALTRLDSSPGAAVRLVFTAHSIPVAMAATCDYEVQLRDAAELVAQRLHAAGDIGAAAFDLVFQSRSGSPHVPWLEPEISDHLRVLASQGVGAVVVSPIGFIADHMEVVYDLDIETKLLADQLGMAMVRARTAGTDPAFVSGLIDLVEERLDPTLPRLALGSLGARHTPCEPTCCPAPVTRRS